MSTVPAPHSITLAEYLALPEDGYRHEVSRGRLVRESQPGDVHGDVCVNIILSLGKYLESHPIGRLRTQSGVLLSLQPLTVRGPDVSLILNERLERDVADPYFHGAPDLVVEVVSPSNRAADLLDKIAQYFEGGAQLVWVVDPAKRNVVVHAADGDVAVLHQNDVLTADRLLPDFAVSVADLF